MYYDFDSCGGHNNKLFFNIFQIYDVSRIINLYEANKKEMLTCIERRLEPLFDRDSKGGRLFVAPRPASKLFSNDGDRAQMNAWNDETVKTPNLFNVFLVGRLT